MSRSGVRPSFLVERLLWRRKKDFIFAIPLIPRHRAKDWDMVLHKLRATLRSALNQTDRNFQIIIGTEDRIDVSEARHENVTLMRLVGRRTPPSENRNFSVATFDLWFRRNRLTREAQRWSAKYVMFLDADDLVSNRLVETVKAMPPASGYALTRGFVMDDASGHIVECPGDHLRIEGFDLFCGSSLVFSLTENPAFPQPWPNVAIDRGHHRTRNFLSTTSTPMIAVEKPLAIYVLNTGINISSAGTPDSPNINFATRTAQVAAQHGRPMSPEELQEFMGA